ncbi:hypothetical protein MRX96_055238 [Rhipicephalus microplus]
MQSRSKGAINAWVRHLPKAYRALRGVVGTRALEPAMGRERRRVRTFAAAARNVALCACLSASPDEESMFGLVRLRRHTQNSPFFSAPTSSPVFLHRGDVVDRVPQSPRRHQAPAVATRVERSGHSRRIYR